jgi:hypothetical protein
MQFDDFALEGYDVSNFGTRIVLRLQRDSGDTGSEQLEVRFSEVALYNFTHTAGAIITAIDECTVAELLNEVGTRVVEWSHSYGIAQWNNSLGGYRTALETQEYKAWRIESAIGFHGFVIAKAVATIGG